MGKYTSTMDPIDGIFVCLLSVNILKWQALRGRKDLLGSAHMDTLMTANNYGAVPQGKL